MSITKRRYRKILLGNEAIAYGAAEAGLGYASAYPGTPSTEIVETLYRIRDEYGFYVEWSVNEKVALEAAYGAAIGGIKSLVAMKHVGLNVAMDPLTTAAYSGVEDSFVIVSADDPSMWSSQNEQDNRWYGVRSYIPVIEPGTVLEIKDMVREAFRLSEKFKHPVIFRTTTRLSHVRAPFDVEPPTKRSFRGRITKRPEKYSLIPSHARRLREELIDRYRAIEEYLSRNNRINRVEGDGDKLIIAVGSAYGYVLDALKYLKYDNVKILKLSGMVPLPRSLIKSAWRGVDSILIVEELEPIVETHVKSLAYDEGLTIPIHGKDYIPLVGELNLNRVIDGIAGFLGLGTVPKPVGIGGEELSRMLPPRPPNLCPGCPHRGTFYALRRAVAKAGVKPIYNGDIGCYSLGILPPYRMQDTIVEMGGSIGLANGFGKILSGREIPIAIIGDSTFYHSGMPPLLNAVYNSIPMLVLILDNKVTAMTGGQPHPGSGYYQDGSRAPRIDLERVVRGLGVEYVAKIDPFNIRDSEDVLVDALRYVRETGGQAVVIAERACTLIIDSIARRRGIDRPLYSVDMDRCTGCGACYNGFSCPAILPLEDGRAYIDPGLCTGCGECMHVCPHDAFRVERGWSREYESLWG